MPSSCISAASLSARSAAVTAKKPGSATTRERSEAASAICVSPLREGGQSMMTRSYWWVRLSSAWCSRPTSFWFSAGESITAERLVPGMMSRWEAASFDHGVGMIARSIVSVRGEESTSAMSSVEAGSPSRPSVESPWGSRSMTSAFTPWCRAAEARPRVTDVLPTPPFREHTLTMNTPAVYRPGQAPRCRDER